MCSTDFWYLFAWAAAKDLRSCWLEARSDRLSPPSGRSDLDNLMDEVDIDDLMDDGQTSGIDEVKPMLQTMEEDITLSSGNQAIAHDDN